MNILIIGSGGREHALAWKINQSSKCDQLFVAPGNAGTAAFAMNVDLSPNDFDAISKFIKENDIRLVVVGPEDPLVQGIRDFMEAEPELEDIKIVGPGEAGAKLEGSKDYSKGFMLRHGIPTAQAKTFNADELKKAQAYIETCAMPLVLKADGLAAGKGVLICNTHAEAKENIGEMLTGKFGEASQKVLIEEFLSGIELSVFILTDGESYKILPQAKDYKRIGEKDTGLNTGGMGAVSPVIFADEEFMKKVEDRIIKPTLEGLKKDGIPYKGFIFIGLMNRNGDPFVIEYNVRMGDPETQSVISRIDSDLVDILAATAEGTLDKVDLNIDSRYAVTVVAVSGGYPESYKKGYPIEGLQKFEDVEIFHAGTKELEGKVVTSGGRVLAATGMGEDLASAKNKAYYALKNICWNDIYFRKDIGDDLITYIERQ